MGYRERRPFAAIERVLPLNGFSQHHRSRCFSSAHAFSMAARIWSPRTGKMTTVSVDRRAMLVAALLALITTVTSLPASDGSMHDTNDAVHGLLYQARETERI